MCQTIATGEDYDSFFLFLFFSVFTYEGFSYLPLAEVEAPKENLVGLLELTLGNIYSSPGQVGARFIGTADDQIRQSWEKKKKKKKKEKKTTGSTTTGAPYLTCFDQKDSSRCHQGQTYLLYFLSSKRPGFEVLKMIEVWGDFGVPVFLNPLLWYSTGRNQDRSMCASSFPAASQKLARIGYCVGYLWAKFRLALATKSD